jgi:hypothetical protein
MVRKASRKTLAAVTMAVAAIFIGATMAFAAQYDGTSPAGTGCNHNGSQYAEYPGTANGQMTAGTLETRYSGGCQTAWTNYYCNNGSWGCTNFRLRIERSSTSPAGPAVYYYKCAWVDGCSYASGANIYSPQVFDGGANQSRACLLDLSWTGAVWQCNNWY